MELPLVLIVAAAAFLWAHSLPSALGVALPGMPSGSPGMGGEKSARLTI
ncbi:MAG: hypothetical protein TU35_008180 [Thermoproteus sp. AZ2]|uniref:Uncharacterized protein n=1 Tax=Thermoproteus sp. AZ2 TaxID=1609232 RepID=A0ACC6V382_9CREN